jgi:transposase
VDVSLDTLDVAQSDGQCLTLINTPEAITKWLEALPDQVSFAIEATGDYHELLQASAMAAGHKVYLLNARQLNHYREAVGPRAKTDPGDARLLLRYLTHEQAHLEPVKALSLKEKRLWRLLQRRAALVKARTQLKLSLRGDVETVAIRDDVTVRLNRGIKKVERLMKQLARDLGWEDMVKRCQTIPGIGPVNAIALVTSYHRGDFQRADQWIAYMGLDVRVRDSGKHKGRRKLTKRGNPELRRLLFNGAMSASKMPAHRPRYEAYRSKGMSSTAALVAMSRKLARIAFALMSKGGVYEPEKASMACMCP